MDDVVCRPSSAPPIREGRYFAACPVGPEPKFSKPVCVKTLRPSSARQSRKAPVQTPRALTPNVQSARVHAPQPQTPRAKTPRLPNIENGVCEPAFDEGSTRRRRPPGITAACITRPRSRNKENEPFCNRPSMNEMKSQSHCKHARDWIGECGRREVNEFRAPPPCGQYVELALQSRPHNRSTPGNAHSISARGNSADERVQRAQDMLHDRYNSHRSNLVFEGFRKMAHDVEGLDPRHRHVHPKDIANFVGELGAKITSAEAVQMLAQVRPERCDHEKVGLATFSELVTGRRRRSSR